MSNPRCSYRGVVLTASFGPTAGIMLKLVTDALPGIGVLTLRHGYETA